MSRLDLHVHTTASDGMFSPVEVVKRAKAKGLLGIAITDHDTVAGVEEARQCGEESGLVVIPGVEISTVANGQDIHVLGYFVDLTDESFQERLQEQREARKRRNHQLLDRLTNLGIQITMEEVEARKPDKVNIGRPHIAEVLVEKGVVQNMNEAFAKYLGKDGAAYVTTPRISPEEALILIRQAGGVPVLAHPGLYDDDELVWKLAQNDLAGIEVNHPDHDEKMRIRYREMVRQCGLLATAGSDFHGERQGSMYHADLGTCTTDRETVNALEKAARSART
ncbi:putative metal-dependent phosphoesterase TrpH [Kroppenstedtia sanguinis]|uniref:PHP domain-containing protein n=1 Tax=Kroppenstedtia sanguinis TaxID=1380684 RepID=A0ABW4C7S4_9BACL